jgi:hypothetical protein
LGGYELGPEPAEQPDVVRAARVIQTAIDSGINIAHLIELRQEDASGK